MDPTGAIILTVVLVCYLIPTIILNWMLFNKAGKPGWAAIIPVYSSMVMAKIGRRPVAAGVAAGVLGFIGGMPFDASILFALVALGLSIWIVVGMASQYNRGAGFWVGYFLLPLVVLFLINDTVYTGNQRIAAPATPENPVIPAG